MKDFDNAADFGTGESDDALLDELEVRCQTNVAAVRESASQHKRMRVDVRTGNACDRDGVLTELHTSQLNSSAVVGIASAPLMVGSVFHLTFERSALDVPSTLAVCDRCVMLSDDSFELRLRFATPIKLALQ